MDNETMLALADKIKNNTASEEEKVSFTQEFSRLIKGIKTDLTQD